MGMNRQETKKKVKMTGGGVRMGVQARSFCCLKEVPKTRATSSKERKMSRKKWRSKTDQQEAVCCSWLGGEM